MSLYEFLCYYKILEGLLGALRTKAMKRAKTLGLKPRLPKEVVPGSPELPPDQRPYVGTPLKHFFDTVLTPKYRNAVAHFITTDGDVLHMSEPGNMNAYGNIVFLSSLCARTVISTHEALLKAIGA